MKLIDDIRRDNMTALREEHGGTAALAKQLDRSESQVSQWILGSAHSATGKKRGMRPDTARYIEKKCGKPVGWLDVEHVGVLSNITGTSPVSPAKQSNGFYEIPQFDTGGAMGGGLVLQDQPGVIQSWKVSPEWLRKNVKGYNTAKSLCIVTGFGDSMRPLFNPGDPLLVDISVNTVDFDSIYFFRVGNEGFIKRLQRIPGEGLRVLSANRDNYEPWTVKPDMDFEVFGRVLKVWRSEDF